VPRTSGFCRIWARFAYILSLLKHYALAARLGKAQADLTVHGRGY
jgi:hypothetical protein